MLKNQFRVGTKCIMLLCLCRWFSRP